MGKGSPVRGGALTVGTIAEIDGFYPPTNHWDTNGFLYANTVYDPLMAVAADGSIQPYLAESMTGNSTFEVWTMTLRPGVKFSDGSLLTAAVVKANFDALLASPLSGPALKQVVSVDVPDTMTVVFTLTGPNPTFPSGLTTQVGYPVGEAMIQKAAAGGSGTLVPVGTGPFIYSQWQPNDFFTATRNPNYWREGLPYLDSITFKPIPDTGQRESTLRTGGVDMIESADPTTITNFSGSGGSGFQLVDSQTGVIGQPTFAFIMLNTVVPPTDDLGVRQALAKGMDQAEVQKIIGGPPAKPATGIFTPGSPYYSDTHYPTYDPSGAKELVNTYKAAHGTPDAEPAHHPRPVGDQGGPGRPADVGTGRVRCDPVRGGAGDHHRGLRAWASSRRSPRTSSGRSIPTSTTCGGAPPPSPPSDRSVSTSPGSTIRRSSRPCSRGATPPTRPPG